MGKDDCSFLPRDVPVNPDVKVSSWLPEWDKKASQVSLTTSGAKGINILTPECLNGTGKSEGKYKL